MLSIIVAVAKNNAIGKDNKLIWRLPEDLKRFKELTSGKIIIMGRKTFESLGRVLPNRIHIILTKNRDFTYENEKVKVVNDIKDIDEYINSDEECFVIGGASIYKILMPYSKRMYITKIDEEFEADTYFPDFDEKDWRVIERNIGTTNEENPYKYEYVTYERI